jgi:hypothetical protein
MDSERSNAGVEPDALDQAIQAALNVDPSPEFLARVRARIAEERPARPWMATLIPVVAAATLAILVLFAVNTSRRPVAEPARPTTPQGDATISRSAESTAMPEPTVKAPPVLRSTPEPSRRAAAAPPLSNEARGLQALVDTINRGAVIVVAGDSQSAGEWPTEIRDLEITPLTIPSLSVDPIEPVAQ